MWVELRLIDGYEPDSIRLINYIKAEHYVLLLFAYIKSGWATMTSGLCGSMRNGL